MEHIESPGIGFDAIEAAMMYASLRDEFAVAAMQVSMAANPVTGQSPTVHDFGCVALVAYMMADEMMKARTA